MNFQIQVADIGTSRERAQITFRGEDGMFSKTIEIIEWSTTEGGAVRTVQGRLEGISGLEFKKDQAS